MGNKISVLFVCAENRCRSPMAQAMLEQALKAAKLHRRVRVDSAGINVPRPGLSSDVRAREAVGLYGIKIRTKSRRIRESDFAEFDHILVMDRPNLAEAGKICPPEHQHKVSLLLEFARVEGADEVPDPFYGNAAGFDRIFGLLDSAVKGIIGRVLVAAGETPAGPADQKPGSTGLPRYSGDPGR